MLFVFITLILNLFVLINSICFANKTRQTGLHPFHSLHYGINKCPSCFNLKICMTNWKKVQYPYVQVCVATKYQNACPWVCCTPVEEGTSKTYFIQRPFQGLVLQVKLAEVLVWIPCICQIICWAGHLYLSKECF